MKTVVLTFDGGAWDGKTLRTDSVDLEEAMLAAACYELSHHGMVGRDCTGVSGDTQHFAQMHGWAQGQADELYGPHRYVVMEYQETEDEIAIRFGCADMKCHS